MKKRVNKKVKRAPEGAFRIGILLIYPRPYHIKMVKLLIDEINKGPEDKYEATIYRVEVSDEEVIGKKVKKIAASKEVDILVTIGEMCSIAAHKALSDSTWILPLFFVGVLDPIEQGLVQSLTHPGGNITGVSFEEASVETLFKAIKPLFPEVNTLLLPYTGGSSRKTLGRHATELKSKLEAIGMTVLATPVEREYDALVDAIKPQLDQVQAIAFLDGCYSSVAQPEMSILSWQKCVVSIGSNVSSIEHGFCISHSGSLEPVAKAAFKQIRAHVELEQPLKDMPVVLLPDNREVTVNIDAFRRIGFPDAALERLCRQPNVKVVRTWAAMPAVIKNVKEEKRSPKRRSS